MRRLTALGCAASLTLVAGLTLTAGVPQAAPRPLPFGPCPDDLSKPYPQMRCATLDVPLDYRAPGGEKVRLMVSKIPARKPASRHGTLLVNPGGPGASAVAFSGELSRSLPPQLLDSFDIVAFDTRNSAHSTPITCVDPATYWKDPLPDPDSANTRALNWQRASDYANGCAQHAGKYLPYLTTPNNARDMDRVRAALGEQKITYLGYSYGTYLGAVYATLFPQRVDRMILDGVVDPKPSDVWYEDNLNQVPAAQRRLSAYFDWIARYDNVFHLGRDGASVQAAWDGLRDDLRAKPHGPLGPSELIEMTFYTLYNERGWTSFAQALSDYRTHHDDHALVAKVTPKDAASENSNAIYTAVECADAPWPTDHTQWEQDSERLAQKYPMAAWFNSWLVAACAGWHTHSSPLTITGANLPPVLMFNSLGDPATPYEGARKMHQALPTSVLVTERNAGEHGVFALSGNRAADRLGIDYLLRGTVPAHDTDIPGHPVPGPAAS